MANNKTINSSAFDAMIFFIMGFVGFSPVSSTILIEVLKFPVSLPELFIFPLLFIVRRQFEFRHLSSYAFYLSFCVLMILLLFGVLYGKAGLYGYLSSFRVYLLIIVFFFLFYKNVTFSSRYLFCISFGALVGSVLRAIFVFIFMVKSNINEEYAVSSNVLALAYSISYSLQQKSSLLKISTLVLASLGAFFLISRGQALIVLMSIVLSLFMLVIKHKGRELRNVSIVLSLLGLCLFAYNNSESVIQDIAPSVHYRLYIKTKSIHEGATSEADEIRLNNFMHVLERFESVGYPHGLVSKAKEKDTPFEILQYRDLPVLELIDIFSPYVFILLVIIVLTKVKNVVNQFLKTRDEDALPILVAFSVFFYSLFFGFGILMDPFAVAFLGVLSGRLWFLSGKRNGEFIVS